MRNLRHFTPLFSMCRNAFRSNNKCITVDHITFNNNKNKKIYNAHIVKHSA